jgi:hypothetical protein
MLDNEDLTLETRMALGKEWAQSLPAAMLCVPYELSRDLIQEAMQGRLEAKENDGKHYRKAQEETTVQREVSTPEPASPGPEPVRETPGNGGGKAAVETVDRPQTPKAKRQGSRKA